MKRYITKANNFTYYLLRVIIEVDHLGDVAASEYVNHPKTVSKKDKLSDEELAALDGLVAQILNMLNKFNFTISKKTQSPKSYAYYIKFTPTDANGDEWEYDAEIQVELRDHPRSDSKDPDFQGWVNDDLFIHAVYVGKHKCINVSRAMSQIKSLCYELREGDYSSLEPFPEAAKKN